MCSHDDSLDGDECPRDWETLHIEFRYGSDKAQLSQMMDGKYAFWMAAGVRKGHEDEWRKGIVLFVDERLKGE